MKKIEGQANLKNYITRFYKDFFGPWQDNTMTLDESQSVDIPQVSQAENKFLTASFTEKKIQDAVFAMEHNKAPGQMASQLSFIKSFGMSSKWIWCKCSMIFTREPCCSLASTLVS